MTTEGHAPLTLSYPQGQELTRLVNALREGFKEPIANSELSASFERGALAALKLVNDIVRLATFGQAESSIVSDDTHAFSEPPFIVRVE